MSDLIVQECATLDDVALVRVLTVDKPNYDDAYLEVAIQTLEKRGIFLNDVINQVEVAYNEADGDVVTVAHALERLDGDWALWSLLTFRNFIGDAWVVQKEYSRFLVHFYEGDVYCFSFFYDSLAQLKDTLKLFLSLEAWETVDSHELNNWKPIFQTRSSAFLTKIVADLDQEEILHTVKPPLFTHDKKGMFILTVPRYHLKSGEQVVAHAQDELAKLYDQAERLAGVEDCDKELAVYDLLMKLVPDNPAVHYNRGQILIETGQLDAAIQALGEAIVLGLPEIPAQMKLQAQRSGLSRVAGRVNPLLSLVVLAQQNNRPDTKPIEYPDYIDDCEMLLDGILTMVPDSISVRHCLATIAELKNDVEKAKMYYREILEIDADDEAAKTNLAYHQEED